METEQPDRCITLRRAAQIAGLSYPTLKARAKDRRGTLPRLRVARPGPRTVLTTRRCLREHLMRRDTSNARAAALPEGYQPPDQVEAGT